MGNCDSCLGGREPPPKYSDEPVYHTPSSSRCRLQPKNEIEFQEPGSGSAFRNYRIVPFDRPPSIKIPEPQPQPEKPRKPYGI